MASSSWPAATGAITSLRLRLPGRAELSIDSVATSVPADIWTSSHISIIARRLPRRSVTAPDDATLPDERACQVMIGGNAVVAQLAYLGHDFSPGASIRAIIPVPPDTVLFLTGRAFGSTGTDTLLAILRSAQISR